MNEMRAPVDVNALAAEVEVAGPGRRDLCGEPAGDRRRYGSGEAVPHPAGAGPAHGSRHRGAASPDHRSAKGVVDAPGPRTPSRCLHIAPGATGSSVTPPAGTTRVSVRWRPMKFCRVATPPKRENSDQAQVLSAGQPVQQSSGDPDRSDRRAAADRRSRLLPAALPPGDRTTFRRRRARTGPGDQRGRTLRRP